MPPLTLFFPLCPNLYSKTDGPRYLFVRLALRRRAKLHRLSDLYTKYSDELGDDVLAFIEALCSYSHANSAPGEWPSAVKLVQLKVGLFDPVQEDVHCGK